MAPDKKKINVNIFAQSIEKMLQKKERNYEIWYNTETISIEIRNGDWKKDHIFVRELVRKLAQEQGIFEFLRISEEAIEETDENHYSATYTIDFQKSKNKHRKGL